MSVKEELFKRFIQLILVFCISIGGYFETQAQEDNRTLKNPNRSESFRKRRKSTQSKITRYTGNVRVDKNRRGRKGRLASHRLRVRGKQKGPSKVSQFTGNYRYRKSSKKGNLRKKSFSGSVSSYRAAKSSKRGRSSYFRGRFRYVNVKANRAQKARRISSFMGKTTYRLRRRSGPRAPRSASVGSYRAPRSRSHRRVANYNQRRLRRGFSKRNANPPAYRKNRSNKLQYNSREAKWLMPKPRKVNKKRRREANEDDE